MSFPELQTRWQKAGYPPDVFDELLSKYTEPHRRYHRPEHLQFLFALLDHDPTARQASQGLLPEERQALELAIWYHDREYVPRSSTNELRSAVQFLADSHRLGPDQAVRARVGQLILATAQHCPGQQDLAASLLCDLDLAILAASPQDYLSYRQAVREEYASLSEWLFRLGRRRFLKQMLNRPALFHCLRDRERPARENLRRELQVWAG